MSNRFQMPKACYLGENALQDAAFELCSLGRCALIVTATPMVECGHVKNLQNLLSTHSVQSVVYADVNQEPTDVMVETGFDLYKNNHCDFLIGLGGGSPLDTAKAIGILAALGGDICDYNGKTISTPLPPVALIPTTAGTGSEVTPFTIITDTKRDIKMLLKGPSIMPALAIVDPMLSMSCPKSVTIATGLDALTHAVESYSSVKSFPQTELYAVSAIKRIFEFLPKAVQKGDDKIARKEMALAAFEAGVSFANSSVTVVHGMSRPIGALFHVPHGISNAMLLTTCLRYVESGAQKQFARLGRAIGVAKEEDSDSAASAAFLKALDDLCTFCEVPTLKEYGIERDKFFSVMSKMADDALASGSPGNTRMPLTKEDILNIYTKLWN